MRDSEGQELGCAGEPDVVALMAEIRERVKADVEANRGKPKPFKACGVDVNAGRKAGEMLHSEDLRYLNSNYSFIPTLNLDAITSHRLGIIGKGNVWVKRKVLAMVWEFLKGYFLAERDFQIHMVRYLNDFTKYVDARDGGNFWELIRKIDVDITNAIERIERIHDEQNGDLRNTERRLSEALVAAQKELEAMLARLDTDRAKHEDRLNTLEAVAHGLEGIVARLGRPSTGASPQSGPQSDAEGASSNPIDYSYLLLENRFRGSEQEIKQRLSIYPAYFKDAGKVVIDIGPGRGELLELFKEQGILARGVELNAAMAEVCKEKGLEVVSADGVAYLRGLEDRSLGGVVAVQVVEHLERGALEELLSLCARKVSSGGKVVFETINPRSLLALSSNYFRDPTHVWPLHSDTMAYAMDLAGLKVIEVRELSPVSQEAGLQPLPVEEFMTPRWAYAVEQLNRNFLQLNALLYGFQDYCIVGEAL